MRELNEQLARAARGAGVRLPAAGDPRRRHVGRRRPSCSRTAPAATSSSSPRTRRRSWPRRASGRSSRRSSTTFIPSVPQVFANVDRDKVLKQGVDLSVGLQDAAGLHGRRVRQLLQPLRPRLAGLRAGRGRLPHERRATSASSTCATARASMVPLSTPWSTSQTIYGPEFTMRFNVLPRGADQRLAQARLQLRPGDDGAGGGLRARPCRARWASTTWACRSRSRWPRRACRRCVIFGFSLLMVFLILAAQYESWTLPFSVLLGMPIAVFGAFVALWLRELREQRLRADRPGHADRPGGEERHPDRRVRQGRVREGQAAGRRRAGRRAAAPAADPDDRLRLHPRRRAAGHAPRAPAPCRARSSARR